MEVFTIELTLNLLLSHVVLTHMTTCSSESTQTLKFVTLRTPLKGLDHQLWWLVMATTLITLDLKFLQRIFLVEDFGGTRCTLLALKKCALGFPLNTRKIRFETIITWWA